VLQCMQLFQEFMLQNSLLNRIYVADTVIKIADKMDK